MNEHLYLKFYSAPWVVRFTEEKSKQTQKLLTLYEQKSIRARQHQAIQLIFSCAFYSYIFIFLLNIFNDQIPEFDDCMKPVFGGTVREDDFFSGGVF